MDLKTRNLFFNAYILPHFDYCNTIWGHSSSEIQTRMLKLQKKAARNILDVDYSHPSSGLTLQDQIHLIIWFLHRSKLSYLNTHSLTKA